MNLHSRRRALAHPSPDALLAWYDRERRVLPWRAAPGERADPYRVWLSEIMLQQTTVAAVTPRYAAFLRLWPDVAALAAARLEDVLDHWAGLGYYARARNLHACARLVAETHEGQFPDDAPGLKALPGIGDYTANAIAAIAFGRPVAAVDANVERVMSRLYRIETPLPAAKAAVRARAAALAPERRAGDFAQGLMDLGAMICTPTAPDCRRCPWRPACAAQAAGDQERYPVRGAKPERPVRRTLVFLIVSDDHLLVRRRPQTGLLGGMLELPSSPWLPAAAHSDRAALDCAPLAADWRLSDAPIRHSFTHFHLDMTLAVAEAGAAPEVEGEWLPIARAQALPSVMKKALRQGLRALPRHRQD